MKAFQLTLFVLALWAVASTDAATKKPKKTKTKAPATTPVPTTEAPVTDTPANTTAPTPTSTKKTKTPKPSSDAPSSRLHPLFPIQYCTKSGCTTKATQLVLDGKNFAPSSAADYPANGVTVTGNRVDLALKGGNGPRVYLVSPDDDQYEVLKLLGKEITYDIDTSQLTCNMNGAFYTVDMPTTGATKGAGYCDANGVDGTYCTEFDVWEANSHANAFTVHKEAHDSSGCGYNNYKLGHTTWYGTGASFAVDTTKTFSVVTQFLTGSSGAVSEIRRIYLQDGKVIQGGALTPFHCDVAAMGQAMAKGHVLALSVWKGAMWWLDAGKNGPCPVGTEGNDAVVTFSNIRIGDIGTTAKGTDQTPAPDNSPPAKAYEQCGGAEYDGTHKCVDGYKCVKSSDYYWQCAQ